MRRLPGTCTVSGTCCSARQKGPQARSPQLARVSAVLLVLASGGSIGRMPPPPRGTRPRPACGG
eukprot:11220820-Lingulodinium_polyedra.AAC.1